MSFGFPYIHPDSFDINLLLLNVEMSYGVFWCIEIFLRGFNVISDCISFKE